MAMVTDTQLHGAQWEQGLHVAPPGIPENHLEQTSTH